MTAAISFEDFFGEVHGHDPFPWQVRLARHALEHGVYPDALDIPTGLGKTSILDVAVWLAAATGCAPGTAGRRRTFFVVDRRLVVDDAFRHAERLAGALRRGDGTCGRVADALRSLCGSADDADPLVVTRMRGGVTWNWRWLDRPDRAAIVVGTVDQLGSRYFFRGYGLSGETAPIDAALTGTDSLFVIDEAHLSTPFIQSLEAARRFDPGPASLLPYASPLVVPMSATFSPPGALVHSIDDRDRANEVASQRLHAPKQVHLLKVEGSPRQSADRTTAAMATLAHQLLTRDATQAIGVVCNSVARARAVFDQIRASAPGDIEVHLLTGRMRPSDREVAQARVTALASAGRSRVDLPSAIVVATQTIEVGADLDFDGLVTESASWDSLVQRLGRLNRRGEFGTGIADAAGSGTNRNGEAGAAQALIVHDGIESPIYGEARTVTWQWLTTLVGPGTIDGKRADLGSWFGASPADLMELEPPADSRLEPAGTPVLMPTILDVWARTSPQPVPDVPVAPFLHGHGEVRDEVRLVWRADLLGDDDDHDRDARWRDLMAAMPPLEPETLAVPSGAFHRWVRGQAPGPATDNDLLSVSISEEDDRVEDGSPPFDSSALHRPAGSDDFRIIRLPRDASRVRPDDLVVLPATAGGCDTYGWAPLSAEPVIDLADLVGRQGRVRISPSVVFTQTCEALGVSAEGLDALVASVIDAVEDDDRDRTRAAARSLFEAMPTELAEAIGVLAEHPGRCEVTVVRGGNHPHLLAAADRSQVRTDVASDSARDPAGTSYSGGPVDLATHLEAVGERARSIATHLGLPENLRDVVEFAARWHDVGKLDRRFQVMLAGGDELAADVRLTDGTPLAKSGLDAADPRAWRRSFQASGLPAGFRHEVGSSAAAQVAADDAGLADVDLAVHLVASHHGRARPLFPPVVDNAEPWELNWSVVTTKIEPLNSVDLDGPVRFAQLNQRYGRWGLALLEAIVRLADIGCSEEGS